MGGDAEAKVNGARTGGRRFSFGMDDLNGRLIQNFFAELLGTMFLIIFCVGSANSTALTALGENSPAYYLSISLAFGLGIGGIVHILSSTSGGHVNPAVSLALFLDRRVSLLVALTYIVAQFAGGFAGAGILYGLGGFESGDQTAGQNMILIDRLGAEHAFFLEVFGTAFLILTILATIDEKRGHAPSYLQPLAIGIAILVMHIFLIPFTNCAINPVRGTVWNVVTDKADSETLIFLFAPFVGSLVAVPLNLLIFTPH
jgi:MIP family channel proteins